MAASTSPDTTQLLRDWAGGDGQALDQLMPRVYRELRRLAAHMLNGERAQTMQATELVHEAWLKLIQVNQVEWQHKAHFFAISATLMRRILLDRARRRLAAKRAGGLAAIDLDGTVRLEAGRSRELVAIDDALNSLAVIDPRKARVVELRFFGGLSVDETAEVVAVSPETVARDWKLARAWLMAEVRRGTRAQ
jgi:RNA polymerase sigma factor (TIGR02999 family)